MTWKQVANPWMDHHTCRIVRAIAAHPTGILVASAYYYDKGVFQHADPVRCVIFSVGGKYIQGVDRISKWAVPEDDDLDSKMLPITTIVRESFITGDLSMA